MRAVPIPFSVAQHRDIDLTGRFEIRHFGDFEPSEQDRGAQNTIDLLQTEIFSYSAFYEC